MNLIRVIALGAVLVAASSAGRSLGVVRTQGAREAWLVFLPGSGCDSYEADASHWIQEIAAELPLKVLVIEKRGVRDDGSCDAEEFNEHSIRNVRIADIQKVMQSQIPKNSQILLMAESEGAYISSEIAEGDPRVRVIINLSGGTRSWIDEEVSFVPDSEKPILRKFFDTEVIGNFDLHRFYRGFSYAELNSYDNHKTFESLRRLQIPILMLNGDRDIETWVDGTREDVQQLSHLGKTNIEMHIFPGVTHSLDCAPEVPQCVAGALRSSQDLIIDTFLQKNF